MMDANRWKKIKEVYDRALDLGGDEREGFLAEACDDDDDLRREVESLLAAHEDAGSFLQSPAVKIAAREIVADEDTSPAPQLIGRELANYRIISLLGRGGMGEVYLAEDKRLHRKVALKLLPAQFTNDAERVRRFEREASAASATNHPNIITIHEIGQVDGAHYIVTEFIDGQTLRQRMQTARLSLSEVVDVAIQVSQALEAAHSAGIVHRDIKPENVMVRQDGLVKVLDFGLAKLMERQGDGETGRQGEEEPTLALSPDRPVASSPRCSVGTDPGTVMGTASYMSPEQARGQKVDARTDIFSLGVALYEMIAGSPPFEGVNALDVIGAILQKEPAPLLQTAAEAPPELEKIVGKALRKDREERYQSAKDLLIDLKDFKGEQAFAAKLESSGQTNRRQVERRKPVVFIALLILVSLAAGVGLYLYPWKTEAPIDSIAVLPFTNQNRAEETEYLADGLTESIINNLTRLAELRVVNRNSAFRYKGKEDDPLGAGQALGVRAVVVGRVLQRGENLMVGVDLVDARDGRQIEGRKYNRKLADVFAVQEEIAKEISEKLRLKLTSAERQQLAKHPTENLKAFQYYTKGRTYQDRRTREDLRLAVRYYEQAIEEDRNYALAYTGLAEAYGNLGVRSYIAPREGRRRLEENARKALDLDENLAEAHVALGVAYVMFVPYNFPLGDRELRRAIELSPSLAIAHFHLGNSLARQGHLDESFRELLKAPGFDPHSLVIAKNTALPSYFKRDYAQAIEWLRQANELGPAFTTTWEVGVHIQNRKFNETLAELEKAKRERPSDPILIYSTGMVYAARGERAEALRIIKELEVMSG
ncbi:MAG: protein kinase, partial [Verrucomicrobiales bacterium]|nr:protein kinase [Verrucomicrobiales bacterium]